MFTLCGIGFEKQLRTFTSSYKYVYAINNGHYSDVRIKMLVNNQLWVIFAITGYEEYFL